MKKYETYLISGAALNCKLLAFDQSTAKTGWAFFDGNQLIDYGLIDKSKMKDAAERMKEMYFEIVAKISQFDPEVVVVENVQQQVSPATTIMLSQLEGMIIGYLYEHDITVLNSNPPTWRSKLGFKQGGSVKRQDLKAQSVKYVLDTYGIDIKSDDITDAICIGTAMNI